jgi:hypothetical protein
MCHGYAPDWNDIETAEREETDEDPEFLNDEGDAEVELLTDGGDD